MHSASCLVIFVKQASKRCKENPRLPFLLHRKICCEDSHPPAKPFSSFRQFSHTVMADIEAQCEDIRKKYSPCDVSHLLGSWYQDIRPLVVSSNRSSILRLTYKLTGLRLPPNPARPLRRPHQGHLYISPSPQPLPHHPSIPQIRQVQLLTTHSAHPLPHQKHLQHDPHRSTHQHPPLRPEVSRSGG